jgi:hypothetical protein
MAPCTPRCLLLLTCPALPVRGACFSSGFPWRAIWSQDPANVQVRWAHGVAVEPILVQVCCGGPSKLHCRPPHAHLLHLFAVCLSRLAVPFIWVCRGGGEWGISFGAGLCRLEPLDLGLFHLSNLKFQSVAVSASHCMLHCLSAAPCALRGPRLLTSRYPWRSTWSRDPANAQVPVGG